jgi:hypothetical protein
LFAQSFPVYFLQSAEQYGIPYNHADHHFAAYLLKPPARASSSSSSMADLGLSLTGTAYGGAFTGIQQDAAAADAALAAAEAGLAAAAAAAAAEEDVQAAAAADVQQATNRVIVFGTDGGVYVR